MQHEPQNEPNTSMHSQPSSAEQNAAVDAALGIDRTKCPKCGSVAGWDQKNGCIECGHRLKKQPAQQQEPVGEVFINTGSGALFAPMKDVRWKDGKMPPEGAKLYTSPQPIKPEQQEPVAWMDGYRNIYSLEEKAAGCEDAIIPLVPATLQHWSDCAVHNEPAYPAGKCDCGGYTSPPAERSAERTPRKPWAGLTAADRKQLLHDHHPDIDPVAFFDAVEAKLKEKNA